MATPQFLAQQSQTDASAEREWLAVGKTVFWAFYDGAGNIKVQKSTDQAATFGAAVTVDSTAGDNDVMLNDPLAWDPVTSRLHLLYGRHITDGSNPAVLCHRYSDDQGATWSAEHVIDNGGARGNNRFYRVGVLAYNGHVSVWYVSISFSTFTTDGSLYLSQSSDGGATWPAAGSAQYAGSSTMPTEPNVAVDGQYGIVSWYDPGQVANKAGGLYCAVTKDGGQTWGARTTINASTIYGRPRPAMSNGTVLVVANSNWNNAPTAYADVSLFRSTDLAATWSAPNVVGTHTGTNALDHPGVRLVSKQAFVLWRDSSNPLIYTLLISTDQGQTFGSPLTPLTTTGNTDAPKLLDTDDYLITVGHDGTAGKTIWSRLPIFAALPGSVATLDNFNRADEDPLSGGGTWTTGITTATPLKLVSSAVQREAASGTGRKDGSYYNAVAVPANNPAAAKITIGQAATEVIGAFLWLINGGSNGYAINATWTNNYQLWKRSAGVSSTLTTQAIVPATGDKLEIQIDGNDLIGWLTQAGGSVYELFRFADSSVRLAFNGGMEINGTNDTTRAILDDFGIATLAVPSNSVAPTTTGSVAVGQTLSVSSDGTWATANGAAPMRWAYQWQTSPDGTTWTNVTGATLPFFAVADATKQHRCVVTATNTIGSASVNSNALQSSALASAFFAAL